MRSVFLVFLLMPSALWAADLKLAFSVDCALERDAETIVRQEAEIEVLQRARMIETFPVFASILELSTVSRKKLGQ